MPRSAFEGFEPYDGNLSRTVLRGLGVSNDPWLPGVLGNVPACLLNSLRPKKSPGALVLSHVAQPGQAALD
jgi:hypothetical protein